MKELTDQIEELRLTLKPATDQAHERVASLEAQITAEHEILRRHIKACADKIRQENQHTYAELVSVAGLLGIYPTSQEPSDLAYELPKVLRPRQTPAETAADHIYAQMSALVQ